MKYHEFDYDEVIADTDDAFLFTIYEEKNICIPKSVIEPEDCKSIQDAIDDGQEIESGCIEIQEWWLEKKELL